MKYRARIYPKYASHFKDSTGAFDAKSSAHWGAAYDTYFRNWLPKGKDAACIDLACGDGALLYYLKQRKYTNISGIDLSEEQVVLARQVVPDVILGDILDFLDGKSSQFDLICGLDIIEHLTKDEGLRFLDGCFGALRPGGRLILQTPNGESPWFGSVGFGDFTHETAFTPGGLTRIMKLCGFEHVEVRGMGPVSRGFRSFCRVMLWKVLCVFATGWNLVEMGSPGSGVISRVFLITGVRR